MMPDPWLWALGQNFQSITHSRLDNSTDANKNVHRIKEYVANGYPVDFGFYVYSSKDDSWTNGGIFPFPAVTEEYKGGHSGPIIGYDDDKVSTNKRDNNTKTGCFLIRNSLGEHGYGWIPYEFFQPKFNGDVLASFLPTIEVCIIPHRNAGSCSGRALLIRRHRLRTLN